MSGQPSVAVIGLGLMGGSLARALRALPDAPVVVGFSPSPLEREQALAAGAVSVAAKSAEEAAAAAETVVYAAPLAVTLDLLEAHRGVWRSGALIQDLSSLMAPGAAAALRLGAEERYVGAHPMAGGEASGFGASSAGLYRDAQLWLSAAEDAPRSQAEAFWRRLGARPAWTTPEAHDERMAWTSHLPQLVSNVLASRLDVAGVTRADLGPGGRDMTRLAGSSPEMWGSLLAYGGRRLAPALREVAAALVGVADALDPLALDPAGSQTADLDEVLALMAATCAWSAR